MHFNAVLHCQSFSENHKYFMLGIAKCYTSWFYTNNLLLIIASEAYGLLTCQSSWRFIDLELIKLLPAAFETLPQKHACHQRSLCAGSLSQTETWTFFLSACWEWGQGDGMASQRLRFYIQKLKHGHCFAVFCLCVYFWFSEILELYVETCYISLPECLYEQEFYLVVLLVSCNI